MSFTILHLNKNQSDSMKTFIINGLEYQADNSIDNILINPILPDDFNITPLHARAEEHMKHWYQMPFVQLQDNGFYEVLCLDTDSWDRPSIKGSFDTLDQAIDYIIDKYRR